MLKLPEIENKQMYSTVKENNGFLVDQTTKEDVMRSMADNRNVYDESVEEQSNTDRPLAVVPTYKKTSTDAHKNIIQFIYKECNRRTKTIYNDQCGPITCFCSL